MSRRGTPAPPDPAAAADAALRAVRRLAVASPAARLQVIRALPPMQRAFVNDFWAAWAHDGQAEPPGDWRVWMIRAGRGFGKTRAGAEWISALARAVPDARIALVGATIAEVARVTRRSPRLRKDGSS